MKAVDQLASQVGTAAACRSLGVACATLYRRRRPTPPAPADKPRSPPPRALSDQERQEVLDVLHSEPFVDLAPAEVYAALLDQGRYLCSIRTMYRILDDQQEVRERRDQLKQPSLCLSGNSLRPCFFGEESRKSPRRRKPFWCWRVGNTGVFTNTPGHLRGEVRMRKPFSRQQRLDCRTVLNVELNVNCRHEIIPILKALQHIYAHPHLRDEILGLVAQDVNKDSRHDCGREGMDYWQILVLAAVRRGCGLDYDQLQDLAENHHNLRHIMGIGDWDRKTSFNWRRIQDNVCHLSPETVEKIDQLIIDEGHRLAPEAPEQVRADSFVVETNIHWPSESTLIRDGVRKTVEWCVVLASFFGVDGWRQSNHLLKKVKRLSHKIERISSRKGPGSEERLKNEYRRLLRFSEKVLRKARRVMEAIEERGTGDVASVCQLAELQTFVERTEQVRETARRRVLHGETVPNEEKLFSMFEPHAQLYKRGKAGEPVPFGRLVLVYEDAAGFMVHHHVLPRDAQDADVAVEQTRKLQKRLGGRVKKLSLDRGFHTPENQKELAKIVPHLCLPKRGAKQGARQQAEATEEFLESRQRHPGVESALGALERGNGMERCGDRTEVGFHRYVALGMLGRNLQVLGKLLIAEQDAASLAAYTKRQRAA